MRKTILVAGDFGVELVLEAERAPAAGESIVEVRTHKSYPMGKGIFAAAALKRLGIDSLLCARLGSDPNGALLKRFCEKETLDTRFLATDPHRPTALTVSVWEDNGQKRSLVYPGASLFLTGEDVEEAFIAYPDLMLLQPQISNAALQASARVAVEKGIPIVLDAGVLIEEPRPEDWPALEVLLVGEEACEVLSGIRPTNPDACLRACLALSRLVSAKYFVLKLGERGSYVYDGKYYDCVPSFDVDEVDTTGAGDVFTAAFLLSYLNGEEPGACCEFANAAAALAISRPGTIKAFPTAPEVKAFLADRV